MPAGADIADLEKGMGIHMLYIGRRETPVGIDDLVLIREFGYSYQRDERLGRWIAEMIEDRYRIHRFNSIIEMRGEFLRRNIHNPLPIRFVFNRLPYGVDITMTGSRARDESEANRLAGLERTPEDYTWHHCENIYRVGGEWKCHMLLIATWYHQQQHMGGVQEYRILKNADYR